MRWEVFNYVRKCDFFQRANPAQDTRVGLHYANPVSQPMEVPVMGSLGFVPGQQWRW